MGHKMIGYSGQSTIIGLNQWTGLVDSLKSFTNLFPCMNYELEGYINA